MLTGRNAKNYRSILSGVSVDELAELIDIDTIRCVENDDGKPVDSETITQYYRAVNKIKQNKSGNFSVDAAVTAEKPLAENAVTEIKPKTRKPRQPKNKA
jgi:hypothetical protein